ncbi:hypothetical protein ES703_54614 [subsurface metagenome]
MLDNKLVNPLKIIEGRIIRNRDAVNERVTPSNPGAVMEINPLANMNPSSDIPNRTTKVRFVKILATFHASLLLFLVSYSMNIGTKVTVNEPKRTAVT